MEYIYETHLHTWEASACALMPGAEYIEYMKNYTPKSAKVLTNPIK